jgi:hypothetical protein
MHKCITTVLFTVISDATSIRHYLLTQDQVYLPCNQCTTVSDIPATLYSVILLSRQPIQSELSLLVLCIIKLHLYAVFWVTHRHL